MHVTVVDQPGGNPGVWAAVLTAIGTIATLVTRWWLQRADRGEKELSTYRGELRADIAALRAELTAQDTTINQLIQEKGECLRKVGVLEYQVAAMQVQLDRYEHKQAGGG